MEHEISVLIIDQMHPTIVPMLEELGLHVAYQPDIKAAEVKELLPGYQGLVVRSKLFISADLLAHAGQLQFIARAGAGVDNIDEAALQAKGIRLLNAPEGNSDAVGEFSVGLLLALLRNLVKADQEVRLKQWYREANRGEEIMGKTIGLIGYGHMGKAFARRLSGFGCQVLANDLDASIRSDAYARVVALAELQEQADVVSFHIPYTPANRHFGDEAFFRAFKKDIWLLNLARGEVVDQHALVGLLQAGKIKGAALDVLENEKLATLSPAQQQDFDWLSQAPNVVLTPHIGGWSHQSYVKINQVLTQKIKAFLKI
jgi:D-3-phosphoglycerate dehydrogenase / 2-oxoglutarate reductase